MKKVIANKCPEHLLNFNKEEHPLFEAMCVEPEKNHKCVAAGRGKENTINTVGEVNKDRTTQCPEHLLNFNKEEHPLLEEVWAELEKIHKSKDRSKIYSEHHGEVLTDQPYGNSIYRMLRPACLPENETSYKNDYMITEVAESIQGGRNNYSLPWTDHHPVGIQYSSKTIEVTELEDLLQNCYCIEVHYFRYIPLDKAHDEVSKIPSDNNMNLIKSILLSNIKYLRENYKHIGGWAIFPDFKTTHEYKKFTEYEKFRKDFIACVLSGLRKDNNKIPTVRGGYTIYNTLIKTLHNTAARVIFCAKNDFSIKDWGQLLFYVSRLATMFEYHHHRPFYTLIGHEGKRKKGKELQAKDNKILDYYRKKKIESKNLGYVKIAYLFITEYPAVYKNIESATAALKKAVSSAKKGCYL